MFFLVCKNFKPAPIRIKEGIFIIIGISLNQSAIGTIKIKMTPRVNGRTREYKKIPYTHINTSSNRSRIIFIFRKML